MYDRSNEAKQFLHYCAESQQFHAQQASLKPQSRVTRTLHRTYAFVSLRAIAVLFFVCCKPKSLYGTVNITMKVKEDAAATAHTITAANWLNLLGNVPIVALAFNTLGTLNSLGMGLLIQLLLTVFANFTANAAGSRTRKSNAWSYVGALGIISINIVQSLVSGVGIQTLSNTEALEARYAREKIEHLLADADRVEDLQLASPTYQTVRKECEEGLTTFRAMQKDAPGRDAQWIRLYGAWKAQDNDVATRPYDQLGICEKQQWLEIKAQRDGAVARERLSVLIQTGMKEGLTDAALLETKFPTVYNAAFLPDGSIRSGMESVRVATEAFMDAVAQGKFSTLGFSLFFFVVSCVTSGVACAQIIVFARREDVEKTRDEKAIAVRDEILEQYHLTLLAEAVPLTEKEELQ